MDSVLNWGIEVVLWFQQFSPALDMPFKALTFLGNEAFYLLFLPLIYWSIDRHTGAWLVILLLFSAMEPAPVFRFIRYFLVGLWGGFGAPWLFVRLKIAEGK